MGEKGETGNSALFRKMEKGRCPLFYVSEIGVCHHYLSADQSSRCVSS
jgi:hypothetical protein